jgi:exodeoxyribonuclease-5
MGDFNLTSGQVQAMKMVKAFMDAEAPAVAVLTGFAGTGKTTVLQALASEFGQPIVLAPTGKAALRVQEATGLQAQTIHRWLYQAAQDEETGELRFKRKAQVDRPENDLIVVDESSMVGRELWEALWDACQIANLRILLVGDPFQLPPVELNKDQDPLVPLVDVETQYRAHLDEVVRQALDNPILRASVLIRESAHGVADGLALLDRVFMKKFEDKCMEVFKQGGPIIVHRNETRHRLNKLVREKLGYRSGLVSGEPLIVTKNNYDLELYNGEVVPFGGWEEYDGLQRGVVDRWKSLSEQVSFGLGRAGHARVMLCPEQVHGGSALSDSVIARASTRYYEDNYCTTESRNEKKKYIGPPHLSANFGYAATCHKYQGSEASVGLVFLEKSVRASTYEGRRWAYTAVTRFKEKCYIAVEP